MADDHAIPVTEAQLSALFLESVCYGLLLVTFGFASITLLTSQGRLKRSEEIRWLLVGVSTASFLIASLDLALIFYGNLQAFVLFKGEGGATKKFLDISNWVNITTSLTLLTQTTLGDAMLVYRCWIIWDQAIAPILASLTLWLSTCSIAIWIIYLQSTLKAQALITAKQLQPAGIAFWALSITLNILTTTLLVYRIWQVNYTNKRSGISSEDGKPVESDGSHPTSLSLVMRYIIESGLLYTATSIITFINVVTRSNGTYVISDTEVIIIPIAFNLITIRTSRISDTSVGRRESRPVHASSLHFASSPGELASVGVGVDKV